MVQSTPSCEQHEVEKFKILSLLLNLVFYFLTCCCCPQGWGPVYIMVQSTPSCKQREVEKFKIVALLHAFVVYFWTCCFSPQGWVACLFNGAKHPFMQAMRATTFWNFLLFLTDSLFNFFTSSCCAKGWGAWLIHGAKHPFMPATWARKIQNICSMTCFPCLFFDLLLLPSRLEGLFISWCKAPLHASNAS